MNLQEWRAHRQGNEAFTLPSGLEVTLKPVTLQDLVIQGKIPDTLFSAIDDLGERAKKPNALEGLNVTDLAEMAQIMTIVCRAAIVAPTELDVNELPFDDRIAIFNRANQEAAKLAPFPAQRTNGGVVAAPTRANVRRKAK